MLLIPGLFLVCIALAAVVIFGLVRLVMWLDTNREYSIEDFTPAAEQPTVPSTHKQ
jgi:hypothetical protein